MDFWLTVTTVTGVQEIRDAPGETAQRYSRLNRKRNPSDNRLRFSARVIGRCYHFRRFARGCGRGEMAYTMALGAIGRKAVEVQVLSPAPAQPGGYDFGFCFSVALP
jgi:hypothetical protein